MKRWQKDGKSIIPSVYKKYGQKKRRSKLYRARLARNSECKRGLNRTGTSSFPFLTNDILLEWQGQDNFSVRTKLCETHWFQAGADRNDLQLRRGLASTYTEKVPTSINLFLRPPKAEKDQSISHYWCIGEEEALLHKVLDQIHFKLTLEGPEMAL